ncbi:MAG: hypothetical protein J6S67_02400 [Methanobrevibacter sp.]|nr:hypothetical protein [Methanobrevibacter sp.]
MRKFTGGYQIIDCGGLDMTDNQEQIITGLFKKAKKACEDGTFVLASNIVWGINSDAPLTPLPVFLQQWNDDLIVATCSIYSVNITSADKCTVVSLVG